MNIFINAVQRVIGLFLPVKPDFKSQYYAILYIWASDHVKTIFTVT